MTLRAALRLMLKELDLTYHVRHEALIITTPEEAELELTTIAYPVSDLVRCVDSKGKEWSDFDTLANVIMNTLAPDSWDQVGGAGAIEGVQFKNTNVLIVAQTQEIHHQVASMLANLRTIAEAEGGDGKPPVRDKPESYGQRPGFGGGYGGGGYGGGGFGGMGGMGSGSGGAALAPMDNATAGPDGTTGLLKGLQDTKRRLQGRQVDNLQRMYDKGKGGMGGGVGAGGMF